MPTAFVKGDLFGASGLDALAHGCDCAGAMGKGIAVEFRTIIGDVFAWTHEHITVFGLAWQDVRSVLVALGESTSVELVVFEKYEPSPT